MTERLTINTIDQEIINLFYSELLKERAISEIKMQKILGISKSIIERIPKKYPREGVLVKKGKPPKMLVDMRRTYYYLPS